MATPNPKASSSPGLHKRRRTVFLLLLLGIAVSLFLVNRSYEKKFSTLSRQIEQLSYAQNSQEHVMDRTYMESKSFFKPLENKVVSLTKDSFDNASALKLLKWSFEQAQKAINIQQLQIEALIEEREQERIQVEKISKIHNEQIQMLIEQFQFEKTKIESELSEIKALFNQNRLEVENLKEKMRENKTLVLAEEQAQIKREMMVAPSEDEKRITEVKETSGPTSIPQETHLVQKLPATSEIVPMSNNTSNLNRRNNRRWRRSRNTSENTTVKNQLQEINTTKNIVLTLNENHVEEASLLVEKNLLIASNETNSNVSVQKPETFRRAYTARRGRQPSRELALAENQSKEESKPVLNDSQEVKPSHTDNNTTSKVQEIEIQINPMPEKTQLTPKEHHQNVISVLDSIITASEIMQEEKNIKGIEAMEKAFQELEILFQEYPKGRGRSMMRLPYAASYRLQTVRKHLKALQNIPEGKMSRKISRDIKKNAYRISNKAVLLKESFEKMI